MVIPRSGVYSPESIKAYRLIRGNDIEQLKNMIVRREIDLNCRILIPELFGDILTILTYAVQLGRGKIVSLLLSSGADPNIRNTENKLTAVFLAVKNNNLSIVKTLLQYHANLDITDQWGFRVLDFSFEHEDKSVYNLLQAYKKSLKLGSLKNLCLAYSVHRPLFNSLPHLLKIPNALDKQLQKSRLSQSNKRKLNK
jgi:ankyrin repeat protein